MARGGQTRFKPGQSGNPAGRPRGIPDRRNMFHWVSAEDKQAVFEKCVELAKSGDPAALRLVLERISPTRKSQLAPIELPDGFEKLAPLAQIAAIDKQVALGEISPDVAAILTGMVRDKIAVIEHEELAQRLETLETLVAAIEEGARNG